MASVLVPSVIAAMPGTEPANYARKTRGTLFSPAARRVASEMVVFSADRTRNRQLYGKHSEYRKNVLHGPSGIREGQLDLCPEAVPGMPPTICGLRAGEASCLVPSRRWVEQALKVSAWFEDPGRGYSGPREPRGRSLDSSALWQTALD
jgi:hypothetical protein